MDTQLCCHCAARARVPAPLEHADPNCDGRGMFRRFDFAIRTASPTPPFITIHDIASAKPLTWPPVMVGGSESAGGSVTTSTSAGPGWSRAARKPGLDGSRLLDPPEKIPSARATAA